MFKYKPVLVVLDSNCIYAQKENEAVAELKRLYKAESILLEKTDVMDTEFQEGKGYPLGLKESSHLIEMCGFGVVGHSRLNHCIVGNEKEEKIFKFLLQLVWGTENPRQPSKQEVRDVMHIHTSIYYGATHFVTEDNELISKSNKIFEKFGLKVMTPLECLNDIRKNYSFLAPKRLKKI